MSLVSAEKSNNQTEEETKIKFDENVNETCFDIS